MRSVASRDNVLVPSAVAETREINWGVASASTSVFGDLLAKSFILAVALSISLAVTSEQHLSFGGEFAKTVTLPGLAISYYCQLLLAIVAVTKLPFSRQKTLQTVAQRSDRRNLSTIRCFRNATFSLNAQFRQINSYRPWKGSEPHSLAFALYQLCEHSVAFRNFAFDSFSLSEMSRDLRSAVRAMPSPTFFLAIVFNFF